MTERENSNISRVKLDGRPTELAHALIRKHVNPGDRVIDATLGNGHDTLFLAELVGATGHVDGFDIQSEAIKSTQQKLQDHSVEHVTLHQLGHESMTERVAAPVQAVMFNLGYLPGGNKRITTQINTSVAALQSASELLSTGGFVTLVVYTGHPGGREETDAITDFCSTLNAEKFSACIHQPATENPNAPFLITIARI